MIVKFDNINKRFDFYLLTWYDDISISYWHGMLMYQNPVDMVWWYGKKKSADSSCQVTSLNVVPANR